MKQKVILKQRFMLPVIILVFTCSMLGAVLSGCAARTEPPPTSSDKLNVVTTTNIICDLVSAIGGERVDIVALMGPGIDPHLYQASAGDVTKMQEADVVVYNGLHLEGKMGDVFSALSDQGRNVICLEQGIDPSVLISSESGSRVYDPHIWFDVSIWKSAAQYVSQQLIEIDPDGAKEYTANLNTYLDKLNELDAYIKSRVDELPEQQRVLVTAHDAFRYFGAAYGFQVIGLQGISTAAEAGTADVSSLATLIASREIKAIFVESSVAPKNIEALQAAVIARGFDVSIGGALYSDSLGDSVSKHDTYLLTFRANIDTIVDALQ